MTRFAIGATPFDDLDIARSHSRPRTSNDNPFSEAGFKTFKYHWSYPGTFGGLADGRTYFELLFRWYNEEHHHSGIADLTPSSVHGGNADEVLAARQRVLDARYAEHPERFVNGPPKVRRPPAEVWINRPTDQHVALWSETKDVPMSPPTADAVAEQSAPETRARARSARDPAPALPLAAAAVGGVGNSSPEVSREP